ncbi:hypothetical protein DSM110093_04235 (plasmid) [Sulfitobacter sp. DSM 110093]|uniref:plasmid mobilization protein n=1 Tax=Sulfitobacter sp. DSM 110093 TaxID=2883127 RepID=UPI001FABCAD5|nr:plasmid mobilization relaxosome protein MobC [Sulfitobacter sp. DSM 110093]UOA34399.1 hypothetical protein DSM110093_04235 [Sulfitobacter sp. DSM 110093]
MRRTKQLKITLSDTEYAALAARSDAYGVSMAGVVRAAVLGFPLPKRRTKIELEAIAALNRTGSNLNQLARVSNRTGFLTADQMKALGGVLKRVHEQVKVIEKAVEV